MVCLSQLGRPQDVPDLRMLDVTSNIRRSGTSCGLPSCDSVLQKGNSDVSEMHTFSRSKWRESVASNSNTKTGRGERHTDFNPEDGGNTCKRNCKNTRCHRPTIWTLKDVKTWRKSGCVTVKNAGWGRLYNGRVGGGEALAGFVWNCCREWNGQACVTKATKNRTNRGNALRSEDHDATWCRWRWYRNDVYSTTTSHAVVWESPASLYTTRDNNKNLRLGITTQGRGKRGGDLRY